MYEWFKERLEVQSIADDILGFYFSVYEVLLLNRYVVLDRFSYFLLLNSFRSGGFICFYV